MGRAWIWQVDGHTGDIRYEGGEENVPGNVRQVLRENIARITMLLYQNPGKWIRVDWQKNQPDNVVIAIGKISGEVLGR